MDQEVPGEWHSYGQKSRRVVKVSVNGRECASLKDSIEKISHLTHDGIFGKVVAFLYVVEFQKCGLPHAHILLILADQARSRTVSDVDNIVCAEIPTAPEVLTEPREICQTSLSGS